MPKDNTRNTQICSMIIDVDKIQINGKGELVITLKKTAKSEANMANIGELVALQQAGTVLASFEPSQQSLEFED